MGRWAQAERRGRGGAGGAAPPAPPTPTLELTPTDVICYSQDVDNSGGLLRLWHGPDAGGPWAIGVEVGWQAEPLAIAPTIDYLGECVCLSEVGNGTNYSGESALCEPQLVTA